MLGFQQIISIRFSEKRYKTGWIKNAGGGDELLVALGKSSRLDAFRQKSGLPINQAGKVKAYNLHTKAVGLDQQIKEALHQAKTIIEERVDSILNVYPEGKKNTFFKIKYGVDTDKIKGMSMRDVFNLLELDDKRIKHFLMIETLCLSGKTSDIKKRR